MKKRAENEKQMEEAERQEDKRNLVLRRAHRPALCLTGNSNRRAQTRNYRGKRGRRGRRAEFKNHKRTL